MKKILICVLLGVLLLTACSTEVDPARGDLMKNVVALDVEGKEADDAFARAQSEFAWKLFRGCAANAQGENLLISPLSVHVALAMTANGAAGDTLTEMEALLGSGISLEDLNEYLLSYVNSLQGRENLKAKLANSVWWNQANDPEIFPEFLQTNATYYGADAFAVPFGKSTVEQINAWVDRNTDGMIPKLFDEMDDEALVYLVNALVLEAPWLTGYENRFIYDKPFVGLSGKTSTVSMMYAEEGRYYETEDAVGFAKPFEDKESYGSRFCFVAMLPNEGVDLYAYAESLDADAFEEFLSSRQEDTTVLAAIPKFSYSYKTDLREVLPALGMASAFDEGNFSRMSNTPMWLDMVIHQAFIELDKNGVKAAAATGSGLKSAELPKCDKTVVLDRPFIYAIVDLKTRAPLFIGVVTEL